MSEPCLVVLCLLLRLSQALAPQLILVRILQGRAWSSEGTYSSSGVTSSTITAGSSGRHTLAPAPIRFTLKDGDEEEMKRRGSYRSNLSSEDRKGEAIEISVR